MDRIRVGLTGLGIVFLITLGATLAFGDGSLHSSGGRSSEFLAQIGVAPGADKDNSTSADMAEGSHTPPPEASGPTTVPAPFDTLTDSSLPPETTGYTPTRDLPATRI